MRDRRIPIKDLLSTLNVGSIRHFSTKFKKEWANFTRAAAGDVVLFAGNGLVFRFDFSRGIVTINPVHHKIEDIDEFRLHVGLFSQHYGLNSTVHDLTLNWWLLSIDVTSADASAVRALVQKTTTKSFESVYFIESDDKKMIQVEVIPEGGNPPLQTGELRDLFEGVAKLTD